jgi:hypothetical protein
MVTTKKMTAHMEATWNEKKGCWGVSLFYSDLSTEDEMICATGKYEIEACDEEVFISALAEFMALDISDADVKTIEEKRYE